MYGKDSSMGINWTKKKSATLKWLGAGPAFLLYLIFVNNMKPFKNGIVEGVSLSVLFILMPAFGVFLIYWPRVKSPTIACPQCGMELYGATEEMIGDIGVCKKCKAEFTIRQDDEQETGSDKKNEN